MTSLSTEELKRKLEFDKNFVLINTLSEHDFESTHIPGSINVPVDSPDFAERVENSIGGKEYPVCVYCANSDCSSSERAFELLKDAGFSDVYRYVGGAEAWEEAGEPLISAGM